MIGFGQDCGNKPVFEGNIFKKNSQNVKYRAYLKKLKEWELCHTSNAKYLEKDFIKYFDTNKLDPIEGIWLFSQNGVNLYKSAVKSEKNIFKSTYLQVFDINNSSLRWTKKPVAGQKGKSTIERAGSSNLYISSYQGGSCNGLLDGTVINWSCSDGRKLQSIKIYPSTNKRGGINGNGGEWLGNGSGIIISKSGYIITNHHVIEDADDIEVEFILDGEVQKFNAEIVQSDKVNDLAIIKILDVNFDGVDEPPYNFKTRSSDVGTKVYAFGYPMALSIMGKEMKVTDGIISSKTGFEGDITKYQITAPIQGGNSGGPLFDDKGNLIGINTAKLNVEIADNVGYSVKTSYVLNLIDILPKSIDLPSNKKLVSLPLTEQIKQISKYVVLVKVK